MDNQEIIVSISCITYNHAPFIRQCLDGFLSQKCNFSFEVLIHDDASTDGTSEIICEYQKKFPQIIKPIIQEENQYSQGVRSIGGRFNVTRANGKYIAMCEGDDYWTDSLKLQKQVDFLEANSEYFACFHHRKVEISRGIVIDRKIKNKDFKRDETLVSGAIIETSIPTLSLLMRNDLNEYLRLNSSNIIGGDVLLRAFISTKGKVKYLNFYGGVYRLHEGGVFSSLSRIEAFNKGIDTREKILKILPNVNRKAIFRSMLKIQFLKSRYLFIERKINRDFMISICKQFIYFIKYLSN